jgi:hypothetical protein
MSRGTMNSTTAAPLRGPVYVVLAFDAIVRHDLVGIALDHDPAASVLACTSLPDAIAAIESSAVLSVAFLELGPRRTARAGVDTLVHSRGGRVVLFGDVAEDEAGTPGFAAGAWTVLLRPFTSRSVCALLSAPGVAGTDAPRGR